MNRNVLEEENWSVPLMWYMEASVHPLLNRRTRDKQDAAASSRDPWMILPGWNIVNSVLQLLSNRRLSL